MEEQLQLLRTAKRPQNWEGAIQNRTRGKLLTRIVLLHDNARRQMLPQHRRSFRIFNRNFLTTHLTDQTLLLATISSNNGLLDITYESIREWTGAIHRWITFMQRGRRSWCLFRSERQLCEKIKYLCRKLMVWINDFSNEYLFWMTKRPLLYEYVSQYCQGHNFLKIQ